MFAFNYLNRLKNINQIEMKMSVLLAFIAVCFLFSCRGKTAETSNQSVRSTAEYDPLRGEGKFKDVVLSDTLDANLIIKGQRIYEAKCQACHKLTDEQLVGPGWKGVSGRHQPEWILNFITNPDPMIDKDPKLQAQLEICMIRMPNQNLSDQNAFAILEFMRKNDEKQ